MSCNTAILPDSSDRYSESTQCRLCTKNNDRYYNIFSSNVVCKMAVKDVLLDLVGLQVALGDGLPDTVCPLCLKKLMEFSDFKKICFESDAELRKCSSRNYIKGIKEEKTDDDDSGSSAETKECIRDTIEGTSRFACSVQRTEIYIPLEDCQLPQAIMMSIKEEMTADDNLESSAETIECVQDMIEGTSPIACSVEQTEIFNPVQDCQIPRPNMLPTFTEGEKLIYTSKMTNDCTTEAPGLSTTVQLVMETSSASVTHSQSKTVASHKGEGRNVIGEDLEEGSAHNADKITSNSIPDDGQSYMKHIPGYFCSVCTKSFTLSSSLKRHMLKHTGSKCYPCRICGKPFTRISNLTEHMRTHTGEKPFSCNHCEMSFSKKCHLNQHMRTHTGEKPYSCNFCSRNFARRSNLNTHMHTHAEVKPHSCNDCTKSFSTKRDLMVHMRTHTAERPFVCSICSKSFSVKSTLILHLRTHTGEKPYSCNYCTKCFSDKSGLNKHLRTHTGEKPYLCNNCTKSFSRKDRLILHLRTHTE